jgi:2-keto-4-pentenoate hydratase
MTSQEGNRMSIKRELYPQAEPENEMRIALQATLEALTTSCSPSQVLGAINLAKRALAGSRSREGSK